MIGIKLLFTHPLTHCITFILIINENWCYVMFKLVLFRFTGLIMHNKDLYDINNKDFKWYYYYYCYYSALSILSSTEFGLQLIGKKASLTKFFQLERGLVF